MCPSICLYVSTESHCMWQLTTCTEAATHHTVNILCFIVWKGFIMWGFHNFFLAGLLLTVQRRRHTTPYLSRCPEEAQHEIFCCVTKNQEWECSPRLTFCILCISVVRVSPGLFLIETIFRIVGSGTVVDTRVCTTAFDFYLFSHLSPMVKWSYYCIVFLFFTCLVSWETLIVLLLRAGN